ncbi:MAG: chemotaxis-specific protein-glutamate methyltransferase CheB [Chloroflexaceae bacterium]|nr:chemotaxis-specific protein-glutamate methyltransferase CheB [Chloroflexaceae bacterium]
MNQRLRILIVDDSALLRSALRALLESDPDIQVVGEATNGREALYRAAELRPDVITMDVRMPVMDGLETTERLMAFNPTPVLAITALYARDDVDISFKMLGAGALEVMEKPDISNPYALERARSELIRRVKLLARVRVVTHLRGRRRLEAVSKEEAESWTVRRSRLPKETPKETPRETPKEAPVLPPSGGPQPTSNPTQRKPASQKKKEPDGTMVYRRPAERSFSLVIIGASTGGPRVVQQILKGLPGGFGAAVLVVQHIAEGFSAGMVEWLDGHCQLPVRLAAEGDRVAVNTVLVAPDSFHLLIQPDGVVHLDVEPSFQRPSVDVAMQSGAKVFGAATTGVLLTGMGRDGALGMQSIRLAGGYTIAQNEASCSIYGMPRAAIELGVVDEILPPEGIIQALQTRFSEGG